MKGIFLCLGLFLAVSPAKSAILYVRADAVGSETNGLSWATAFKTISEGLQYATTGDELWVAAGTYTGPVEVPSGVALYGGFAGNESSRTQRDWERSQSAILWQWSDYPPYFNDQFGPAVSLGRGSRLDGFTVINGWHSHGAAVYATDSGAVIANNIIVTNIALGILPSAVLVDRSGHLAVDDDFFLKTANDLLRLQFPFAATNIPVAQYGPVVHRVLQIAANIYDAARSNTFPSVFRPQFASDPEGPIISGYYEDHSAANVAQWLTTENPYGIPMIIGARKGLPNFNEFALQTSVMLARRLELRRQTTNSPPYQTNEMYMIGVSNFLAVEAWNSYTQTFGHDVQILLDNRFTASLISGGLPVSRTEGVASIATNFPAGSWPGFTSPLTGASFELPLVTNQTVITNSAFRFDPPALELDTTQFEVNSGFRIPDLQLTLSNHLAFVINSGGRIVDFVLLRHLTNTVRLTDAFFQTAGPSAEGPITFCWGTNRQGAGIYVPTGGIQEQIDISVGQVPLSPSQWTEFNLGNGLDMQSSIAHFRSFLFPNIYGGSNTNLIQVVPFSPVRKLLITATWEANDPLVHSLSEHLKDGTNNFTVRLVSPAFASATNSSLGKVNARYRPWGGAPGRMPVASDFDRRVKDPGGRNADRFDFPNGSEVNIDWLDHIHRGTPWQTLYFDRDAVSTSTWRQHSLDPGTHPTNDWKIIEYLRGQLTYSGSPTPTRVVNNTIVGNEGGVWIAANASASVMNNAVVANLSGIIDEGGSLVELSHNCDSCSPQFVNAAVGDFSVLATSPLVDGGDNAVLAWIERPVLGAEVDIGALEFGPEGVPVFTFRRTSPSEYELALHGFSGQSYVVETSTNLVNWTAITTNIAAMGSFILQDAAGTNYAHRFYRAKVANHPN